MRKDVNTQSVASFADFYNSAFDFAVDVCEHHWQTWFDKTREDAFRFTKSCNRIESVCPTSLDVTDEIFRNAQIHVMEKWTNQLCEIRDDGEDL